MRRLAGMGLGAFLVISPASGETLPLRAVAGDGKPLEAARVSADEKIPPVWKSPGTDGRLLFKPADSQAVSPAAAALYLKIDYFDRGYGKLAVRLLGDGGKTAQPDRFLNLSRTDSGKIISAEMRVRSPGSSHFSVSVELNHASGEALAVAAVTLQDTPFDSPDFRYVISDPWLARYQGPSVRPRDNTTLAGKVMVGYQGWFRTPNDPDGRGWVHWGDISAGKCTVDMWPDVTGYPAGCLEKAADVKLLSGRQGYLFSSAWPEIVDTHFRWMREYDIDGAFLQRFVNDGLHSIGGGPERVLANVRAAANREGRLWAIEYDVSGYPDAKLLETLRKDWRWLVDDFHLLDDPNYARENGKPVVFIWGMPFPDRRISLGTADAVVDFFKNDPHYGGNHVIGGIPGNWRSMDAGWQAHFRKYDGVLAWMSGNYAEDLTACKALGLNYHAHVRPGFSWANLKHLPTGDDSVAYTPREGGKFYRDQFAKAVGAGADRIFVGMFDEYDEGTAILPMSDDPPPTPIRPGVAATFYNGDRPLESGKSALLPAAEIAFGNPPAAGIGARDFFVRMGGRITFPETGSYWFFVESAPGDDVELTLGGKSILKAGNLGSDPAASEPFSAGQGMAVSYRLDCRHRAGTGELRLSWETPAHVREPVPAACLADAWGRFLTNEGQPADLYLQLTRSGKRLLKKP